MRAALKINRRNSRNCTANSIDLDQRSASPDINLLTLLIIDSVHPLSNQSITWIRPVGVQWDLHASRRLLDMFSLSPFLESPPDTKPARVPESRRRPGRTHRAPGGMMLCRLNMSDRPGRACPLLSVRPSLTVEYWWQTLDVLTVIDRMFEVSVPFQTVRD